MRHERCWLLLLVSLCLLVTAPGCALVLSRNSDSFTNLLWASSGEIFFIRDDYGVQEGLWVREVDGDLTLIHENGQRLGFCDRAYVVDTSTYSIEAIGIAIECMDEGEVEFLAYRLNVDTYNIGPIADSDGLASVLPIGDSTAIGVERILGENGCRLLYSIDGRRKTPLRLSLDDETLGQYEGSKCRFPRIGYEVAISRSAGLIGISVILQPEGKEEVVMTTVGGGRSMVVFDEGDMIGDLAFTADGASLFIRSTTLSEDETGVGIVRVDTRTGEYDWLIQGIDADGMATSPDNDEWVYTIDGEFVFGR